MIAELTAEQLLWSIWAALRRIETNLALPPAPLELPAPTVTVLPPDLTDVVEAVNGLRPGVDADQIAEALARVLAPGAPQPLPGVEDFTAAVKELSWRLKGVGAQAYGAAATSGTAVAFRAEITVTVRAVGASTLLECGLVVSNTGVTGIMSQASGAAIAATGTFNNNTALFLNVSYKAAATTTTSTFQLGHWELVKQ